MTWTLDQTEKSSSAVPRSSQKRSVSAWWFGIYETSTITFNSNSLPITSSTFLPPGTCLFLLFTPWENKGLQEPARSTLAEVLPVHYDQLRSSQSLRAVLLASPQPEDMLDITYLSHPVNRSTKFLSSMSGSAVHSFSRCGCNNKSSSGNLPLEPLTSHWLEGLKQLP